MKQLFVLLITLLYSGQLVSAVEPRLPDPLPFGDKESIAEGVLRAATANDGVVEVFLYYAVEGEAVVSELNYVEHTTLGGGTSPRWGPHYYEEGQKEATMSPSPYFPNNSVALNFALGDYIQLEEPTVERFYAKLREKMRHLISVYFQEGDAFHRSASDLKELDKGIDPDRFFFGLNANNHLEKTASQLWLLNAKGYGDTSGVFTMPESLPEGDEELELPQFEVNLRRWLPVYAPGVKWIERRGVRVEGYNYVARNHSPLLTDKYASGEDTVYFFPPRLLRYPESEIVFYWDEERTQYTVIDNGTGTIVHEESTVIPEPYKSRVAQGLHTALKRDGTGTMNLVIRGPPNAQVRILHSSDLKEWTEFERVTLNDEGEGRMMDPRAVSEASDDSRNLELQDTQDNEENAPSRVFFRATKVN